ncbi:hypothetical protein STEG23_012461, partial [Scotinomys teguina]
THQAARLPAEVPVLREQRLCLETLWYSVRPSPVQCSAPQREEPHRAWKLPEEGG